MCVVMPNARRVRRVSVPSTCCNSIFQTLSAHSIKYFLKVDKIDVQSSLPFMTLFNDFSQAELVCPVQPQPFRCIRLLPFAALHQKEMLRNDFTKEFTLTLSLKSVMWHKTCHYMVNISSICLRFGQQKGLRQICLLKAQNHTPLLYET